MYKEEYNLNANSAFPIPELSGGMTLLDYIAAKAMGTLCNNLNVYQVSDSEKKQIAERSYSIAAAMMEERKKYLNALQD